MSILSVENLSFSYEEYEVLKSIYADFEEGKLYVILGPNGSGKTTLLNCIMSNLTWYSGIIRLKGKDVKKMTSRERARLVSYVPQNTIIDFEFTAREIVLMGRSPYLRFFENESIEDVEIARECMAMTNVLHLMDKNIKEISGGERQRVLIARALCQDTPIMVLDEPASSLDIYHEINVMDILRNIVREKKRTVICVMHDLNTAARYADYLYLMSNGSVVARGEAKEVFNSENLEKVYSVKSDVIEIDGKKYIVIDSIV
ncbi:MAG: ABC transporter ATP-binding protein [Clostridiaceae bacterium]|jgi:iron complex transport system ATP-binding protein|nr:ABC transporter ATP-binding protein [Clostridiaceae bacterium]